MVSWVIVIYGKNIMQVFLAQRQESCQGYRYPAAHFSLLFPVLISYKIINIPNSFLPRPQVRRV